MATTDRPPAPSLDMALDAVVSALHGEARPGQREMAQAVADTIVGAPHLLVQAGTGTGKSVAYLVPSVLAATRSGSAVVVATATLALQRQLIEHDLPIVADALEPLVGRRPTYAVLKGRHHYVCRDKVLRGAGTADPDDALFEPAPSSDLGRQAVKLRAWVDETPTGDRDDVGFPVDSRVWRGVSVTSRECIGATACSMGETCFAEAARASAAEADVVVTNHAMLAIATVEGIPLLPPHQAVVVDEGHELVDRVTGAVTVELSAQVAERAVAPARRLLDGATIDRVEDAIEVLRAELEQRVNGVEGPVRLPTVSGSLVSTLALLRDAMHEAGAEVYAGRDESDPEDSARRQRARAGLLEVHDTAGRMLMAGEREVVWVDAGRTPTLHLAPLSVASVLRASLFDEVPVVLTSATLELGGSFDQVAYGLGLGPGDYTGLDVGSPFDHASQGILYTAAHLPPPGRDGLPEEALDELAELVDAAGGRTLALFSSWRAVERASERLRVWLAGRTGDKKITLLVAKRGEPVSDLVREFAADPRAVLLGTMALWQGVDVPGQSCTLVVIDRIPFPRPDDPVMSARAAAADAEGSNGFMTVSVPRAALLLAQGSGRLIRSSSDRGVVALLDPRLVTARYGGFLRRSLPEFWPTTDGVAVRAALRRLDEAASSEGSEGSEA
ncbi:MAG: ATP-dependent helicase [Actinobacteria bacterium]|uniref:DNA 5'-3' helicase n=1 Tax=freshwater metagenome TaxID=449393 RepID=A0A6J7JN10_9ZZZZ|nr:ATP-dependent helicase [Actinomycetota bacterium]